MADSKNIAAQMMAQKRWEGVSKSDRRAHALRMVAARKPRKSSVKRAVDK